jgi:chemotaxis response regulator CheB
MPPLLSRIIEDLLAAEADMLVVGRTSNGDDSLRRACDDQADMLITQDGENGDTCLDSILRGPALTILAINRDGRDGSAISLARRAVELDSSGGGIAEVIRHAAVRS